MLAQDLHAHQGSSVVIAGDHQPPAVHALAHAMNAKLGNVGKTVFYTDTVEANPANQAESIKDLVADMGGGKVDLLVILGGNPAYDAPADLNFADALNSGKVPLRVHLGLYQNETAELCQWHVNQSHELEAWGDARAYDGTVSIIQPLIAPLYNGKSALEFVALLSGQTDANGYDLVRAYWQKQHTGADFEQFWRKSLHDGWIEGTAFAPKSFTAKSSAMPSEAKAADDQRHRAQHPPRSHHLRRTILQQRLAAGIAQADDQAHLGQCRPNRPEDGRAPADQRRRRCRTGTQRQKNHRSGVDSSRPSRQFGHDHFSATAASAPDASVPRRVSMPTRCAPARILGSPRASQIRKTGSNLQACLHAGHADMDTPDGGHRPLVRETSLEEYRKEPNFAKEEETPYELSLYKPYPYKEEDYAWGMTIDLNSCVGCNNCMLACQSENNIAVVGKEQTKLGRHMHWIRVDAYYQGDRDNPRAFFQPVPCMQCENAPCEVVCPVGATNHTTEGLNDMVYNRCVGTRYCSNNCPYKVRRFNFLLFQDWETPQYKMMRNPDVSVRSRGVMEKCTYCVQRINERRIDAEREDRKINDTELQTACQQSCPAGAIIFGNINDPNSKVSKLKAQARNYSLLGELNTRPRTTYLAEVRNPNPELKG